VAIAKMMKKNKYSTLEIAKLTELTQEEIDKL